MIFLANADLVLPDRVMSDATLVIDGERILDILQHALSFPASSTFTCTESMDRTRSTAATRLPALRRACRVTA
jgi:hypothetical protein